MKLFTLLSFIFLLGFTNLQAHEYHFAFAEAEYNWQTNTIQVTISVSSHDFEHTLSEQGMAVNHLESYSNDKMMQLSLSDEVLKHFKIDMGKDHCLFAFQGFEVLNTGMTNFYYESQPIQFQSEIKAVFDIMIDYNQEQQNKLTFINDKEKVTVAFLFNQKQQLFKLETTKE